VLKLVNFKTVNNRIKKIYYIVSRLATDPVLMWWLLVSLLIS